ncbi:hypothetical protein [Pseudomonas sp.]|uniref:hypothetical protein n=1 Tax=Pseudomonas sp. TaxID=306 RepID=UPI002733DC25|nr:hypothetical protein [Pseudomonas sp.]MDP3816523.1 hypothetical protein [Pseudomonas sp.]
MPEDRQGGRLMHGLRCAAFCAILLYPSLSLSSNVFRCENGKGQVTFAQHGCPGAQTQQLQHAYNPTPGSGKPVPLAKTRKTKRSAKQESDHAVVVVGVQQDGCGNRLSSSERRTAIIRQKISSGMSRADVESSLGKPDRITQHNGQARYLYRDKKGNSRQVSFDEAGCVKGKAKR